MSSSRPARRPRTDAQRNRDAVLTAAKRAFADEPAAYVSMPEVARRAGVGVGTVYRHFPSRRVLLEAVFADEVDRVCTEAAECDDSSPGESLEAWLHTFFSFARARNNVAVELISNGGVDTPLFMQDRATFCAAGEPLLAAAQAAGAYGDRLDIGQILDALVWLARGQADEEQVRPIVDALLLGLQVPG